MKQRFDVARCCCIDGTQPVPVSVSGLARFWYPDDTGTDPLTAATCGFGRRIDLLHPSQDAVRQSTLIDCTFLNVPSDATFTNVQIREFVTFVGGQGDAKNPNIRTTDNTIFAVCDIVGEATLSPGTISTVAQANAATRTTASVTWSIWSNEFAPGVVEFYSPNFASVLNELIALGGWNPSSQNVRLFLDENGSDFDNVPPLFPDRWGVYAAIGEGIVGAQQVRFDAAVV